MRQFDPSLGCLLREVSLPDVCVTSVNRCSGAGGLAAICAFAPDGAIFVAVGGNNAVLSAPGWRFSQAPAYDDQSTCNNAACAPACPNTPKKEISVCTDAAIPVDADATAPDGSASDSGLAD